MWYQKLILIFIIFISWVPATFSQHREFPQGDGKIRLFNYHLNEFVEVEFRDEGGQKAQSIAKINHLLRSRDNSEIISIDARLLDLLDHLQDHFQVDTIEIISGYRRQEFNQKLLKSGRKVSPRSLHMQGRAMDIHIDEIREETLRDYLLDLKLGGVGYYGPLDFVHIDTGPFKTWSEPVKQRKLIGVIDPKAPIQLTSDRNDYLPKSEIRFLWKFRHGYSYLKIENLQLEHFWRGQWRTCRLTVSPQEIQKLNAQALLCPLNQQANYFGKYRWTYKLQGNSKQLSSNEFYLKKQ